MPATICLRSIHQLLNMRFVVPSYQRGYRWTAREVEDLLTDLHEFQGNARSQPEGAFYCLQPVVVRKQDDGRWELIDGQQRLTTLFLVLSVLQPVLSLMGRTPYEISYDIRKASGAFLKSPDPTLADANIDFHHLDRARHTIEQWFADRDAAGTVRFDFARFLLAADAPCARVIWYELPQEEDPIEVFVRLNVGRIPLTSAELIRALFLRTHNYDHIGRVEQVAQQWDLLEKHLRNDAFWYFLNGAAPDLSTRIEYLFAVHVLSHGRAIAHDNTYGVFVAFLQLPARDWSDRWRDITQLALRLEEWFEDRALYHLVGTWMVLQTRGNRATKTPPEVVVDLLRERKGLSRPEFERLLRHWIGDWLLGNPLTGDSAQVTEAVAELSYGRSRDHDRLRDALLLFNIASLMANTGSNQRFPFDLFQKRKWDLEHVRSVTEYRPSRTENQRWWLERVHEHWKSQPPAAVHQEVVADTEAMVDDFRKERFDELYMAISAVFGEAQDPHGLHSIGNLALLDQSTNRGYGNLPFPLKRRTVLDLDKTATFVPLCTTNVFLKYYSGYDATSMAWQDRDAIEYGAQIQHTLTDFFAQAGTLPHAELPPNATETEAVPPPRRRLPPAATPSQDERDSSRLATLHALVEHCGYIRIPKIQRDFAQGRDSVRNIRRRFLGALRQALDAAGRPLDLDFVYGTLDNDAFRPLDGQQRLTTLFLLHWYLAQKEGRIGEFRAQFRDDRQRSRFTYEVRPTSVDFFDGLVRNEVDLSMPPAQAIRASRWTFLAWERDPTIVSCLAVLDTIHELFGDLDGGYDRLVSGERITFQFLDLGAFGLTEDLYIKMNARGKPLTSLETFKAALERQINRHHGHLKVGQEPLGMHLSHAFDTRWTDLFWVARDDNTSAIDGPMMFAIAGVALLCWEGDDRVLKALVERRVTHFDHFRDGGLLTDDFLQSLVALFDRFCDPDRPLEQVAGRVDGVELGKRLLEGKTRGPHAMTYSHWLLWTAWCAHLLAGRPLDTLGRWMRVVKNLVDGTLYNRLPDFVASVESLRKLASVDDVHALLCDPDAAITGFNRQQIREERLKAMLMARSAEWTTRILTAESHPYFQGQLEFLFAFSGILDRGLELGTASWDDAEDVLLMASFDRWWTQVIAVFPVDRAGLFKHDDDLWRRALLAEGDYLIETRRNRSVLNDLDRDTSWKRLLRGDLRDEEALYRRDLVRRLLDRLAPEDVEAGLRARLAEPLSPMSGEDKYSWDWRTCLVEEPALFKLMTKQQLRFGEDGTDFLLSKVQRNGRHWDLYVAWLGCHARRQKLSGKLDPITDVTLRPVASAADRSDLRLTADSLPGWSCVVLHRASRFRARLLYNDELVEESTFSGAKAKVQLQQVITRMAELAEG